MPLDVHAQNLVGALLGLFGSLGQLDAARLAAPAGEHLRLDDDRPAEFLRDFVSFLWGACYFPLRDGDAKFRKTYF